MARDTLFYHARITIKAKVKRQSIERRAGRDGKCSRSSDVTVGILQRVVIVGAFCVS